MDESIHYVMRFNKVAKYIRPRFRKPSVGLVIRERTRAHSKYIPYPYNLSYHSIKSIIIIFIVIQTSDKRKLLYRHSKHNTRSVVIVSQKSHQLPDRFERNLINFLFSTGQHYGFPEHPVYLPVPASDFAKRCRKAIGRKCTNCNDNDTMENIFTH